MNPSASVNDPPRPPTVEDHSTPAVAKSGTTATPAVTPVVPPRSSVHSNIRPWTGAEDHELFTFKNDTRSRPSWKTIGLRLKRDPEVCSIRWQTLKQTMPEMNPRAEPEAETED